MNGNRRLFVHALTFLLGVGVTITALFLTARTGTEVAATQGEVDVYYPGTEALAPDEMRVVALGTGMPSPRPKQAAACWLVELGNGDKFLFDLGAGCHERISAQKISYDLIDKMIGTVTGGIDDDRVHRPSWAPEAIAVTRREKGGNE